jgi:putative PIG3 family NAD(P)H quinone oxidoreductase
MKAIIAKEPGSADVLVMVEYPTPEPAQNELLVRVKATALNRADILQRMGKYPPPKGVTPVLGLEMSGVVEKVGSNVSGWKPGDRVCALLPGGGYAEYVTIPAQMAIPIPDNLTFEEAAAIPEAFLTAFQALYWLGNLREGQNVLIHAGASGVGTAAIQLVRGAGATAIITAGSAKKLDFCTKLGAKVAINYKAGDFLPDVLEATDNRGVDIILDFIGANYWHQNLSALAIDGRMILLATMSGGLVNETDLRKILVKRLQIIGTTLRSRDPEYKQKLTNDFVRNILPGFEDGTYRAVIDTVLPWRQVKQAHRMMEENKNIGKIVLKVEDDEPEAS